MKQLLLGLGLALAVGSASADITLMVPQKPGAGTSIWAEIVAAELQKAPALNGEKVVISYNPGARDIPGPNKFHEVDRFDPNTVLVSHGGNAISFLQEAVKYDYREYDSICNQNLNIIVAKRAGVNEDDGMSFAAGSGMVPEALAMTLLIGGPDKSVDEYIKIFNDKVVWVTGLDGAERRLAFQRGELLGTRENPAAFKSKVQPLIDAGEAELWFHHGLLDLATKGHVDDPNFKEGYRLEDVFKAKWGVEPSGDLYDAYTMIHSWRDALQKALWVNRGNPNTEKLRLACQQMAANPESRQVFQKKVGHYDWMLNEAGNYEVEILMRMTTEKALKALVKFNSEALGLASVYKPELVE